MRKAYKAKTRQSYLNSLIARGVRRIFLEVNTENQGAINLYHELGFINQGYLGDYYGSGHYGLRMGYDSLPLNILSLISLTDYIRLIHNEIT